jgi:small conductance mechanosensitive channel
VLAGALVAFGATGGAPAQAQTGTEPTLEPASPPGAPPGDPATTTIAPGETTTVAPDEGVGSEPGAPPAAEPEAAPGAGSTARVPLPEEPPEGFSPEQWATVRSAALTVEACGAEPGAVCGRVFAWTGNRFAAESAQWVLEVPTRLVVIAVAAFVANRLVRRAIARQLARMTSRSRRAVIEDPANVKRRALRLATASSTVGSAATVTIFAIAALIALGELGVNLGPMLAGAGIAGIAIGFGAQNLVRDVLAGLFVVIEDQYGVGDIIDVGTASGVVEEMTLRVTKLRDVEGTLWFVPNGVVTRVGNRTQVWSRAILDIEIAHGADHHRAGEVIKAAADALWREAREGARIIEEPELWGVERISESGVTIRLAVKSAPAEQFRVARLLRSAIKDALEQEGIETPFLQRTVPPGSAGAGAGAEPRP